MFGKKKEADKSSLQKVEKLSGPESIPQSVGRFLVVDESQNPDWVWNLKAVKRANNKGKKSYDVRVFDPVKVSEASVKITDYNSFDVHPELVLFEGWFDKETTQAELKSRK